MNISKALKLKNRLAGEVSRLKGIVIANNSYIISNASDYDVKEIFEIELQKRVQELVLVKTVIATSNSSIDCNTSVADFCVTKNDYDRSPFWAIFMIAELKGLIETLQSMSTKHGIVVNQYDASAPSIEYISIYKSAYVDTIVKEYQSKIDKLQDDLDTHNAIYQNKLLDDIQI